MYLAGASNDSPSIPSMKNLCDNPTPSVSRPPVSTDAVKACWASTMGCRGYTGTTLVPSSIRFVCPPIAASEVNASSAKMFGNQNVSSSACSARCAAASASANVTGPDTPTKRPTLIFSPQHPSTNRERQPHSLATAV